jgi:hypothetical protein
VDARAHAPRDRAPRDRRPAARRDQHPARGDPRAARRVQAQPRSTRGSSRTPPAPSSSSSGSSRPSGFPTRASCCGAPATSRSRWRSTAGWSTPSARGWLEHPHDELLTQHVLNAKSPSPPGPTATASTGRAPPARAAARTSASSTRCPPAARPGRAWSAKRSNRPPSRPPALRRVLGLTVTILASLSTRSRPPTAASPRCAAPATASSPMLVPDPGQPAGRAVRGEPRHQLRRQRRDVPDDLRGVVQAAAQPRDHRHRRLPRPGRRQAARARLRHQPRELLREPAPGKGLIDLLQWLFNPYLVEGNGLIAKFRGDGPAPRRRTSSRSTGAT